MDDSKIQSIVILGSVAVIALLGMVTLFNSEGIDGAATRQWGGRPALQRDIELDTASRPAVVQQPVVQQQPVELRACSEIAANKQEEDVFKARGWCK